MSEVQALASILRRVNRPRAYAGDWEADTARRQLAALADAGFDVVKRQTQVGWLRPNGDLVPLEGNASPAFECVPVYSGER